MSKSKATISLIALLSIGVLALVPSTEASAAYSSYCGNGTHIWNSGGYQYKAVFQSTGTPSGGYYQKMYHIYKASQMTGWIKIVSNEEHTCPFPG